MSSTLGAFEDWVGCREYAIVLLQARLRYAQGR